MFRKTLSTAVSFLMIGLALAGTLISCDGNAAMNMADEEKVVVSASVMDETKSLEAHVSDGTENGFSAASYNNITHYKWIMKTDSPKRVYDSGYITRAEAEANHLYANPYDNHEIVTGRYQYDFYGYVYDDIHNEYLQVAEAHATDVIVNAKTQNISITLQQLSNGQNRSANLKNDGTIIYAQLPIDFYRAFSDGVGDFALSFAGSYVDVAGVMGSAQDFGAITIEESDRAADSGKNIVKLTIADQLPTGSYKISITASLKNVSEPASPVEIDTKTAVDILRSIERTTAIGDMNFASTTLNAMNLFADLTDKVGDHIDIEEKDGKVAFTITGQNNQDGFELTLKNPTLQQTVDPAPDKLKAVFYLNGTALEASTDYNASDNGDNTTTYKFTSSKFTEGINILSVTFVDERYQMSAGSATFEVTLNPDQYYVRISPVGAINCTIGNKLMVTAELVDNETGLAVATAWAWTEESVDTGVIGIASQAEQLAKANPIFNTVGATPGKAKLKATATVGGQTYFAECEVTLAN